MKIIRLGQFVVAGLLVVSGQARAQGGPPADNIIDGRLYPPGYTPPPIPQQ